MTRNSTFAARLKEIMTERGYSYSKLGELLEMNPQTLNRYVLETRIPKIDVAVSIAKSLNVELLWLQGFDVPKSGAPATPNQSDRGESILLANFRSLNPDGMAKAIAYTHALRGLYPAAASFEPILELASIQTDQSARVSSDITTSSQPEDASVLPKSVNNALPPEEVEALCRACAGDFEMELVEFKITSNILIVCVQPSFFSDEDSFISVSCRFTALMGSQFFDTTSVDTAAFFFQTEMVDREDNESVKNVLKIIFSRPASQMSDEFQQQVTADYNLVFDLADEFYIHPAIKAKLKKLKL